MTQPLVVAGERSESGVNAQHSHGNVSGVDVQSAHDSPQHGGIPPPPMVVVSSTNNNNNNSSNSISINYHNQQSSWSPLKSAESLTASFHQHAATVSKTPVGSPVRSASGIKTLRRSGGTAYLTSTTTATSSTSETEVPTGVQSNGSNNTLDGSTSKILHKALTVVQAYESFNNDTIATAHNSRNVSDTHPPSPLALSESSHSSSVSGSSRSVVSAAAAAEHVAPAHIEPSNGGDSHAASSAVDGSASSSTPSSSSCATFAPPSNAPSFRKIAKKRRKQPGADGMERSSFHHTKSSKEYLRKAQEALRLQESNGTSSSLRGGKKNDSQCGRNEKKGQGSNTGGLSPRSNFARQSLRSSLHNPGSFQCRRGSASDGSDSDVPPTQPVNRRRSCGDVVMSDATGTTSSFNPGAVPTASTSNPAEDLGYEDPDSVAAARQSNADLGYEDPDAVAASRQSAVDLGYEDADAVACSRDPGFKRRGQYRRRGSVTKYSLQAANAAKAATERMLKLQGLSISSRNNEDRTDSRSEPAQEGPRRRAPRRSGGMKMNVERPTETESLLSIEMKTDNDDKAESTTPVPSSMRGQSEPSNTYGYEETTVRASESSVNQYGYEDPDTVPQQKVRRHPGARRRGSVTKYSISAAAAVSSAQEPTQQVNPPADFTPRSMHSNEDSSDDEPLEVVLPLKGPAPSRFSPDRENEGDFEASKQSPYFARRRSLFSARRNSGDGLAGANPSAGSDGNFSMSPRRRNSIEDHSSSSRGFRRPMRSNSTMSQHSVASFEDDADSVANDLESLCSIHDRGSMDVPLAPPPPPAFSPVGTPRNSVARSRSGSLRTNNSFGPYKSPARLGSLERTGSTHSNSGHFRLERRPRENDGPLPIIAFATETTSSSSSGFFAAPLNRTPSSSSSHHVARQAPSAAPSFSSTCSFNSTNNRRSSFTS